MRAICTGWALARGTYSFIDFNAVTSFFLSRHPAYYKIVELRMELQEAIVKLNLP